MCQNGNFSLEIEQNQQNQKKKKDFHGIKDKILIKFFLFLLPNTYILISVILLKKFKPFFNLKT
ncbi:hypothetical protein ID0233_00490 [Helicobacter pylori]